LTENIDEPVYSIRSSTPYASIAKVTQDEGNEAN
jgi:hypothetical protein